MLEQLHNMKTHVRLYMLQIGKEYIRTILTVPYYITHGVMANLGAPLQRFKEQDVASQLAIPPSIESKSACIKALV